MNDILNAWATIDCLDGPVVMIGGRCGRSGATDVGLGLTAFLWWGSGRQLTVLKVDANKPAPDLLGRDPGGM